MKSLQQFSLFFLSSTPKSSTSHSVELGKIITNVPYFAVDISSSSEEGTLEISVTVSVWSDNRCIQKAMALNCSHTMAKKLRSPGLKH